MKVNPPEVTITDAEPFKEALFARKEFAESLTNLLKNAEENLIIFVNAPWGEGKTTFAKMWQKALKLEKFDVIYFDAYAADYFEDPFVSFSGEILALAEQRFSGAKAVRETREFKKTAIDVGKRLAGLAIKIGARAATLGALDATHLSELKEIGVDLATGVSEIGASIIEKKIENHTAEKDALAAFKRSLGKLADIVRKQQGFPLMIIVDELDRCRPDFALSLLERIKHLFDVSGVSFVLFVNREQIETYISSVYGDNVDSSAYLLKFGNVFVDLPIEQPTFGYNSGRSEFCRQLFRHFDFSNAKDGDFLGRSMETLVTHFSLTLREIERVFTTIALYYASLPHNQLTNAFLIPLLAILKVKRPAFYQRLRRSRISTETFFKDTGLDQITDENARNVNREWIKEVLNFCLMSETQFTAAVKEADPNSGLIRLGHWLVPYNVGRHTVIPFFCERLDRFSVKPES